MIDLNRRFVVWIMPRTKKNSQEIRRRRDGTAFVSPSSAYRAWENTVAEMLAILNRGEKPISEPVNLREVIYMPTARRVDQTNLMESVDDALVKAGVIADDCTKIVAGHEGSCVRIDRANPRIEITITPAEEWQIFREVRSK